MVRRRRGVVDDEAVEERVVSARQGCPRARTFCFTMNNYSSESEATMKSWWEDGHVGCQYLGYGRETCPSTGTPHLQGFMKFANQRSVETVRALLQGFHAGTHIEICNGSDVDNTKYMEKENDVVEYGVRPMGTKRRGRGEQQRWENALELARSGDFDDVPADIQLRYHGGLRWVRQRFLETRTLENVPRDNHWFYGRSGTGKSTTARALYPDCYLKPHNKWWNGYETQDTCLIDDLGRDEAKWMTTFLKTWGDRFPFHGEVKGGSFVIRPKRIVVTSNYTIQELFGDAGNDLEPLLERFKQHHFHALMPGQAMRTLDEIAEMSE